MWYLLSIDSNSFFLPLQQYSHQLDWFNDDKEKINFLIFGILVSQEIFILTIRTLLGHLLSFC